MEFRTAAWVLVLLYSGATFCLFSVRSQENDMKPTDVDPLSQENVIIRLGGLFENRQHQLPAFKYAIDSLNKNTTFLPGVKFEGITMEVAPENSFAVTKSAILKFDQIFKFREKEKYVVTLRRLVRLPNVKGGFDFMPLLKQMQTNRETKILLDCDVDMIYDFLSNALSLSMVSPAYHYIFTTLDLAYVPKILEFQHAGANITTFRLIDPEAPIVKDLMSDLRYVRRYDKSVMKPNQVLRLSDDGMVTLDLGVDKANIPLENHITEVALVYDSVFLFAKALANLKKNLRPIQHLTQVPLSCDSYDSWGAGLDYTNALAEVSFTGLSGPINFKNGRRLNVSLDILTMSPVHDFLSPGSKRHGIDEPDSKLHGLVEIGNWAPYRTPRIKLTRNWTQDYTEALASLLSRTIKITTILEEPFVMLKEGEGAETLTGNDMYEGFCIDLIDRLAKMIGFNYSIHTVKDGQYGAPLTDDATSGPWNGMIGEIVKGEVDLALAPLTISFIREQSIDFTKPFLNLGISILYKKPVPDEPDLYSFLQPLHIKVWIYIVTSYLGVSVVLYVIARFSPYEWVNPHPCNADSDLMENQFDMLNSLWFTIGSLMQQGCEVAPRATSTRLVSGLWWFFTLIMISSYTANLAAFLTVTRMNTPIKNADDLSKQTEINYGCVWGGSTMSFFKNSKIKTYERMWNYMLAQSAKQPSPFVNKSSAGIKRVKNSKYAYLMESVMIEYQTQRDCQLMQIGGLLDTKGYGIGTTRGSPLRDELSSQILKLQEEQYIAIIKNKWWKEKRGGGRCDESAMASKNANALDFDQVAGVFVLLLVGVGGSILVVIFEFCFHVRGRAKEARMPFSSVMSAEFKASLTTESERRKLSARSAATGDKNMNMPLESNHAEYSKPFLPVNANDNKLDSNFYRFSYGKDDTSAGQEYRA